MDSWCYRINVYLVLQDEWKVEFKGWMKSWFYKMNELVVQQDEETVGIIGWTNSDHGKYEWIAMMHNTNLKFS